MNLLEQAATAAKAARLIAEKADNENRNMTASERADFDVKFTEATEAKAQHDRAKGSGESQKRIDAQVLAQVKAITDMIGGEPGTGMPGRTSGRKWAADVADRLEKVMPRIDGQKAIVSGTIGVPNVVEVGIVSMGQVPTSILDLIPSTPAPQNGTGGNSFSFLRQTTRTNNAAPVADGDTKPTSVYTVTEEEDRFRVIAHLSEAIPKRYFDDHKNLEQWLESEMAYGLRRALETEVLAGDGTGEHFTGILNTSGIVSVTFATDVFTTTRKAKTGMVNGGQVPTAWVFNPADDEALDLSQDDNGQFYGDGPFNSGPGTLWGLPRVPSTGVTAGTAVLADWAQAELLVREDANLAIDAGGTLFAKNQVQMRVEGRFGLAVLRPAAFAKVALAA